MVDNTSILPKELDTLYNNDICPEFYTSNIPDIYLKLDLDPLFSLFDKTTIDQHHEIIKSLNSVDAPVLSKRLDILSFYFNDSLNEWFFSNNYCYAYLCIMWLTLLGMVIANEPSNYYSLSIFLFLLMIMLKLMSSLLETSFLVFRNIFAFDFLYLLLWNSVLCISTVFLNWDIFTAPFSQITLLTNALFEFIWFLSITLFDSLPHFPYTYKITNLAVFLMNLLRIWTVNSISPPPDLFICAYSDISSSCVSVAMMQTSSVALICIFLLHQLFILLSTALKKEDPKFLILTLNIKISDVEIVNSITPSHFRESFSVASAQDISSIDSQEGLTPREDTISAPSSGYNGGSMISSVTNKSSNNGSSTMGSVLFSSSLVGSSFIKSFSDGNNNPINFPNCTLNSPDDDIPNTITESLQSKSLPPKTLVLDYFHLINRRLSTSTVSASNMSISIVSQSTPLFFNSANVPFDSPFGSLKADDSLLAASNLKINVDTIPEVTQISANGSSKRSSIRIAGNRGSMDGLLSDQGEGSFLNTPKGSSLLDASPKSLNRSNSIKKSSIVSLENLMTSIKSFTGVASVANSSASAIQRKNSFIRRPKGNSIQQTSSKLLIYSNFCSEFREYYAPIKRSPLISLWLSNIMLFNLPFRLFANFILLFAAVLFLLKIAASSLSLFLTFFICILFAIITQMSLFDFNIFRILVRKFEYQFLLVSIMIFMVSRLTQVSHNYINYASCLNISSSLGLTIAISYCITFSVVMFLCLSFDAYRCGGHVRIIKICLLSLCSALNFYLLYTLIFVDSIQKTDFQELCWNNYSICIGKICFDANTLVAQCYLTFGVFCLRYVVKLLIVPDAALVLKCRLAYLSTANNASN